jgi:hypothetical protein
MAYQEINAGVSGDTPRPLVKETARTVEADLGQLRCQEVKPLNDFYDEIQLRNPTEAQTPQIEIASEVEDGPARCDRVPHLV